MRILIAAAYTVALLGGFAATYMVLRSLAWPRRKYTPPNQYTRNWDAIKRSERLAEVIKENGGRYYA